MAMHGSSSPLPQIKNLQLKGTGFSDRIRMAAGIDSLTDGAGSPSSTWRSTFSTYAKSVLGDGGPGLTSCNLNGNGDYTGYGVAGGVAAIPSLAWSNAIRQKSCFGNGLYTTGVSGTVYWGANLADETALMGMRLICELRSDDASFRWRMNSAESGTGDTISVAGGYTKNVLLDLFRRPTPGATGAKGILIDQIVGDTSFYLIEPVRSTPGFTLLNLGIGGAKAADWYQLDDTRCRDFIKLFNLDIMMLNAGANDKADSTFNLGKYLNAIVDRFKVVPTTNLFMIRPNALSDETTTNAQYFTEVIRGIANSRGCGYIDDRDALGATWAIADAAGYMYDTAHPNAAGNAKRDQLYRTKLGI